MIKCNVTINGVVSKAASCRTNHEGKPFVTFALQVVIPANNGINQTLEISAIKDGTLIEAGVPAAGSRVEVTGTLTLRKRGDNLYFNLSATGINQTVSSQQDSIRGTMDFRGKVGKTIDEKTSKNGKPYLQFSAFSTEKVSDGFEYTWIRFIGFDQEREAWLQTSTLIQAKGELELSVYNDKLNVSCRIEEMAAYVKPPYNPNN